ncbi:MAG: hypothetical protein RBS49_00265 [Sphaerochaeta sp.]|jgi:hypothetical protein|nr:hypothetical protein [Sphaerochaeta sp.]MDX9914294.1 hypothetical protein [Sphaerochaeta sp.]
MKKKLLIVFLILAVLVPATLSAKLFDLSLGPNVQFKPDFAEISGGDMGELFSDINNYAFGADLRLKLLLAEVDLVSTFGKATESGTEYTEISILTSAGVSFDLFGFTRLGIGLGPRFQVLIDDAGNTNVLIESTPVEVDTLGDAFIKSPLALRATADFKIGKMWLGASYTLDTDYTFENYDQFDKLFSAQWDTGRFGVSLLFSFF